MRIRPLPFNEAYLSIAFCAFSVVSLPSSEDFELGLLPGVETLLEVKAGSIKGVCVGGDLLTDIEVLSGNGVVFKITLLLCVTNG
jgi:hypothetical protein